MLPLLPAQQEPYITSCFSEAAYLFRQEVSLKNKEVLHQPASWEQYCLPHISIELTELKAIYWFAFLGFTITSDAKLDKEVDNRVTKVIMLLADYTNVCSATDTWRSAWRSAYIEPLPLPSSTIAQSCGSLIVTTYDSSRGFTSTACAPSLTLTGAKVTSIDVMQLKFQQHWAGHVTKIRNHQLYSKFFTGHRDNGTWKNYFTHTHTHIYIYIYIKLHLRNFDNCL